MVTRLNLRERFIKQEQGELEELKRKEQAETEKQQQRILIGSAKTLEELEKVAKILGYKKGWAYKVFQSRNKKLFLDIKHHNLVKVKKMLQI